MVQYTYNTVYSFLFIETLPLEVVHYINTKVNSINLKTLPKLKKISD